MKTVLLLTFTILSLSLAAQSFQGELLYEVSYSGYLYYKGDSTSYVDQLKKKGDYYDTLSLIINGKNYIKTLNKSIPEKNIVLLDKKHKYTITESELVLDDLGHINLVDQKVNYFGEVKNHSLVDTIIKFQGLNLNAQKLIIERDLSVETFIFSDSLPKLSQKRNLLNSEDWQVYDEPLNSIIGKSIVINYAVLVKMMKSITVEMELIKLQEMKVSSNEFRIPAYKDQKGMKKFNKKSSRFKFYKILN